MPLHDGEPSFAPWRVVDDDGLALVELPHFAADRPWERAHLVVDGAPPAELPAGAVRVWVRPVS